MRHLKRWWRGFCGERLNSPRRTEIAEELRQSFGLEHPPRLHLRGSRGHDGTYLVENIGILRLANPHKNRPLPASDMPFVLSQTPLRIDREWNAYGKCAPLGLTPKPLWRTHDALLCEYLPCRPLQAELARDPASAWEILLRASQAIHRLHQAGIVHMDMSLANILADDAAQKLTFIDFEYAPAPHISPAAARVYDHLRLLESTWKFIPPSLRADGGPWLDTVAGFFDSDMRRVHLDVLKPALGRICQAPELDLGRLCDAGKK